MWKPFASSACSTVESRSIGSPVNIQGFPCATVLGTMIDMPSDLKVPGLLAS